MFGAAAASLWALQQIKDTQHKKLVEYPDGQQQATGGDRVQNLYVLTRIADAYAQAAERETDALLKLSHWQAAKNAVWVARLLFGQDDESLEQKFTLYSDMEAGMQNQIRDSMVAKRPLEAGMPLEAPNRPPLDAGMPEADVPPAAVPAAAGASFFPSSPFESGQQESGGDSVPDALMPIKTQTSKSDGIETTRVQPYSAEGL